MTDSPSTHTRDTRQEVVERRMQVVARLQVLRTQAEELQHLLTALREQHAVVHEERQGVSAEYRLLADDAAPSDWTQQVLEHERHLLREEAALGQERLRLIAELRRIREERVTLLGEQAALLAIRNGSLLRPWVVPPRSHAHEP